VNLPVGAIAAASILVEFPYFRPHGIRRQIDWFGVFTLAGCLIPLLLALTWVTDYGWGSERVVSLLMVAAVMAAAFLFAETRATEPVMPLSLFKDSIISISTVAVFLLGVGMFGVIVYIPLFMQSVLGVTATRSGSLLTPLMLAFVAASATSGNLISRTGRYRVIAIIGASLTTFGIILMAAMNADTTQGEVIRNMIIAGLGMGLVMPVYTLAVQNVAPPEHMGSATASSQFFRSIGGTVGVAIFGSVLLRMYHASFQRLIPPGTPASVLAPFNNPLQLRQISALTSTLPPGQLLLIQRLFGNVRQASLEGLHSIFVMGAVLMSVAVVVNFFLREVPLRKKHHAHVAVEP
jgi:MFS family permease